MSECRQALGGHGYSQYAGISYLMFNSDVNQTFEGDNYVLLMSTARMILKNVVWLNKGKQLLETVEFLTMQTPEKHHFSDLSSKNLVKLFMVRARDRAMECSMNLNGKSAEEFNVQQPFAVREMCEAYHQLYLAQTYEKWLKSVQDEKVKDVFESIHSLYLKSKIIKDGDYFKNWLNEEQF
jgi:acyl-CoA oxidase